MTPRQKQLLDFITDYIESSDGISPSFDEMKTAMGASSKSGIHRLVEALVAHGKIVRLKGRARSVALPPAVAGNTVSLANVLIQIRNVSKRLKGPVLTRAAAAKELQGIVDGAWHKKLADLRAEIDPPTTAQSSLEYEKEKAG